MTSTRLQGTVDSLPRAVYNLTDECEVADWSKQTDCARPVVRSCHLYIGVLTPTSHSRSPFSLHASIVQYTHHTLNESSPLQQHFRPFDSGPPLSLTHADCSRGSIAVSGVCVCVCVCLCLSAR